MKRVLFVLLFVAGVLFALTHPPRVSAGCPSGSTCGGASCANSSYPCLDDTANCGAGGSSVCCKAKTGPPSGCSCGGTSSCYGGSCNPGPYCRTSCTYGCSSTSCSGGTCNPAPTSNPTSTPAPCRCDQDTKPTDCTTRSGCPSHQCFPVCNYSGCPTNATWACTSEDSTCTTLCNNANSWSAWYCTPSGIETRYCTLAGCTAVAQAQSCSGPTPTSIPGCTRDCSGVGNVCSDTTYPDPNCGEICTGTKDCTPPTCSGVTFPSCITPGTSFTVTANGVNNATQVKFPTWSSVNLSGNPAYDWNGQDDLVWYTDNNGAPWQMSIAQSSHLGGAINVHVYMDNNSSTNVWCNGRDNIPLCCTPNCGDTNAYCSGTTYNDSCGNPTCTGTKPSYCSSSCGSCGCSSISCTGGVCKVPAEPYCSGNCFYGCSSTSCTGGTCYCPTTVPTSLVPPPPACTNTVFPRTYSWTGNTNATGYQFQLYKGALWCKNISLGPSTTSYNLTSCDNPGVDTTTGAITWGVAAHYSHNSCADSAYATKSYSLDKTAPTVPSGLTATCDMYGKVSASWDASTDPTCSTVDSYWAQVSKDPTFATAYDTDPWLNTWTSGISKSTGNGAFSPGTVYLHVRSRDGLDNQSLFSSPTISILCPIPTGTIQAQAVLITSSSPTCGAIVSSTSFIRGDFFVTEIAGSPVHAEEGSWATWNAPSNVSYGINAVVPGYAPVFPCWSTDGVMWTPGPRKILPTGGTLQWKFGYKAMDPWVQVRGGGDVYAGTTIQSPIPATVDPRFFCLNGVDGSWGTPGVVTYGSTNPSPYDFDPDNGRGETYVSSKNWLVNESYETIPKVNFYDLFYHRFGSPTSTDNSLFPNLAAAAKPASRSTPYYITGPMTTTGTWTVGDGESIVFLVDGNLTIGGQIKITGTGFISFIVNGNITVAPTVGVSPAASPPTPVLEGIYITSPTGIFSTGASAPGIERFVGRGIFVAGSFSLLRNLGVPNNITAASLFIYNPQLLITMPDEMKEIPITWQEVAP